jgi:formylmethanofuran--tetrahydromethanopterin N-formyltransferase
LVKPFTAVFDATGNSDGKLGMIERVGHCGDGFEWTEQRYGRKMIVVPLMVSNFLIENELGYAKGVMGANFWYMCKTKKAVVEAGKRALEAIHEVEGVVTPFDICSAGSKPETKFPLIGPTTNHPYCSSLKTKLGAESKVPNDVKYIPEVVINGTSMKAVKSAMKAGIQKVADVEGVIKVSAGNYGGKLGKHKIYLKELF